MLGHVFRPPPTRSPRGSGWGTALRVFTVILGLALPSQGLAQDGTSDETAEQNARIHFLAGRNYFTEGQYERAAAEFMEAYRLSSHPELLVNAANAYAMALMPDEAIAALEELLRVVPPGDTEMREQVERRLVSLREARERGTSTAVAPGALDPASVAQDEVSRAGEGEESGSSAEEEPSTPMSAMRLSGVVTTAAGGALGVASLFTGLFAHRLHGQLDDVCGPDGTSCPADRQGDIDRADRLARTSTATLFAGAAAVAVGVTLMVVGGHADQEPGAEVSIGMDATGARLTSRWTF